MFDEYGSAWKSAAAAASVAVLALAGATFVATVLLYWTIEAGIEYHRDGDATVATAEQEG